MMFVGVGLLILLLLIGGLWLGLVGLFWLGLGCWGRVGLLGFAFLLARAASFGAYFVFGHFSQLGRDFSLGDRSLEESLDTRKADEIVGRNESHGATIAVGTSRTTDAMHIILGIVRHIEIDHHLDIIDIDAARDDIGGYHHIDLARLEIEHYLLTLRLIEVGVHLPYLDL